MWKNVALNSATAKSPARELAEYIGHYVTKATGIGLDIKVSTLDRGKYKIQWQYWQASPNLAGLIGIINDDYTEMPDDYAIDEDMLEYDVEGNAILPSDVRRDRDANQRKASPEEVLKYWVDTPQFKITCANFGFKVISKLYTKEITPEATGSNARAFERAFGYKPVRKDRYYTMTISVEQVSQVGATTDHDWMIKALDMLFRHCKVFVDGKKQYVSGVRAGEDNCFAALGEALGNSYPPLYFPDFRRKGNIFTFRSYGIKDLDWERAETELAKIIQTFYPDYLEYCTFQADPEHHVLTLTVN